MSILNVSKFETAVNHIAKTRSYEDRAYANFGMCYSHARVGLESYFVSLEKDTKSSVDGYSKDPAFIFEQIEDAGEIAKVRLHKMALCFFALQRELGKEDQNFAHLLNKKIEIGEAVTEITAGKNGKPYNSIVAVNISDKAFATLVAFAIELIKEGQNFAAKKTNQFQDFFGI